MTLLDRYLNTAEVEYELEKVLGLEGLDISNVLPGGGSNLPESFSSTSHSLAKLMPSTVAEAIGHLENSEPLTDRKYNEVRGIIDDYTVDFDAFRRSLSVHQHNIKTGGTENSGLTKDRVDFFEPFLPSAVVNLIRQLQAGEALESTEVTTVAEGMEESLAEPLGSLKTEFELIHSGQGGKALVLSQMARDLLQVLGEDQVMESIDANNFSSVSPYWLKRRMAGAIEFVNKSPQHKRQWNVARIRDVFDSIKMLREVNEDALRQQ